MFRTVFLFCAAVALMLPTAQAVTIETVPVLRDSCGTVVLKMRAADLDRAPEMISPALHRIVIRVR